MNFATSLATLEILSLFVSINFADSFSASIIKCSNCFVSLASSIFFLSISLASFFAFSNFLTLSLRAFSIKKDDSFLASDTIWSACCSAIFICSIISCSLDGKYFTRHIFSYKLCKRSTF